MVTWNYNSQNKVVTYHIPKISPWMDLSSNVLCVGGESKFQMHNQLFILLSLVH